MIYFTCGNTRFNAFERGIYRLYTESQRTRSSIETQTPSPSPPLWAPEQLRVDSRRLRNPQRRGGRDVQKRQDGAAVSGTGFWECCLMWVGIPLRHLILHPLHKPAEL